MSYHATEEKKKNGEPYAGSWCRKSVGVILFGCPQCGKVHELSPLREQRIECCLFAEDVHFEGL